MDNILNIKKYFWELNERAIRETENKILKNPQNPEFIPKMFTLLSRCDEPDDVFSAVSKKHFTDSWPNIRRWWKKRGTATDFLFWWETIYEQLLQKEIKKSPSGSPIKLLKDIGKIIRKERIEKGWSQAELAKRTGLKQSDISKIERGITNITIVTLNRFCKILNIQNIRVV